jgi:predicted alpha/beta-fold hydrolase
MTGMKFPPAPAFRPALLLRSGHAQTLAGVFLPCGLAPDASHTRQHVIALADGDAVVLHEDRPEAWKMGDPAAILIHGLAGSFESGYMQRAAARLYDTGYCTFRFDMRGCGAAYSLAQHPAHSGRTSDLLAAFAFIQRQCSGSRIAAFGFSLGGNLLLNTLAELGSAAGFPLEMAVAVCPPIDLAICSGFLKSGRLRIYDRHFITALLKTVADRQRNFPAATAVTLDRKPTSLWDFDNAVTAPLCGFPNAEAYYRATSPGPRLAEICLPTLILASDNDPLVPARMFAQVKTGAAVSLQMIAGGGHLGFISDGKLDADRRWLDWRLVQWAQAFQNSHAHAPIPNQV